MVGALSFPRLWDEPHILQRLSLLCKEQSQEADPSPLTSSWQRDLCHDLFQVLLRAATSSSWGRKKVGNCPLFHFMPLLGCGAHEGF